MRPVTPLALTLALCLPAVAAQAQTNVDPFRNGGPTCAAYDKMDYNTRVETLRGIPPVGGDLGASDSNIVAQWTEDVAKACKGHPNDQLSRAADRALITP